jgi:hypothetical protein
VTVNELSAQIECLQQNIKVERLLEADRVGQEAMRSNIETVKLAAIDLVTSAASVATLSASEKSDATVQLDEKPTTDDHIGSWLTHAIESHGSETASYTSAESICLDYVFGDAGGPLTSLTSEAESIVTLPLRARGKMERTETAETVEPQ